MPGGATAGNSNFSAFSDFDDPFEQEPVQRAGSSASHTAQSLLPQPHASHGTADSTPGATVSSYGATSPPPPRRVPSGKGKRKQKLAAEPASRPMAMAMAVLAIGAAVIIAAMAVLHFLGTVDTTSPGILADMPTNVLVTGCGLGNRLVTIASFMEAGREMHQETAVIWTLSATMAAPWYLDLVPHRSRVTCVTVSL